MKIQPVIMSGGAGTRLWPLSRRARPKQFLNLVSDQSLFQETVLRTANDPARYHPPLIIAGQSHAELVSEQLRQIDMAPAEIVLEPCPRNTAAVAAVAAAWTAVHAPDALVLLTPADHHIEDANGFRRALEQGCDAADNGAIVTFGIKPTSAHTGYGYIQTGEKLSDKAFRVAAFKEKPDSKTAQSYLADGKFFWNAGIFLFRPQAMLDAMRDHDVKRIVFSSTAAVYGNPEDEPIQEDSRTQPINPYGRSKLAFEYILKSYEEAYGIRHAVLRYFNAAGATPTLGEDHDPETHIIPLTLQVALGQREHISIFGTDYDTPDGTCVRDYIHVSDLAEAHRLAIELIKNESVTCNLGNGLGFSVREVIEACRSASSHPIPAVEAERRAGDPDRLTASAQRAQERLGWEPKISDLGEIVTSAWNWHKAHPNGYES